MSQDIKQLLRRIGVRPSKERGQNFLLDLQALESIVEFGKPQPDENLLEIGPGLGALTAELNSLAPLTVVELEPAFVRHLSRTFPDLKIIQSDIREVDLTEFKKPLVIFGNLPYSLSSEILFYMIAYSTEIRRAVLLLQKEFVARLSAKPGVKAYGALSISCQMAADVRTGPIIGPECFHPKPKIDSQVIELRFLDTPRYELLDRFTFLRLVRDSFAHRRRKIMNSLLAEGNFTRQVLESAMTTCGISPELRAEALSMEDYARLSDQIFLLEKE